jgi:dTDP-L-rhamnose 4-epimerase
MNKKVLITGGAGFIGSHLVNELLEKGYSVRVLDNLTEQVHGNSKEVPSYLNKEAEFILGDVRDTEAVRKALEGVDVVYHFAAAVGVGQSMFQIKEYTEINNIGTAVLLEELIKRPVQKLIVASSMSIYGEGLYQDSQNNRVEGVDRKVEDMKQGHWDLYDAQGEVLNPVPTPENKKPALSSVYALSKYDQERLCLMIGKAYNIPTVALRFFNVYGPNQSLNNPYTGVFAIFASRYLNDNPPLIFEDGHQKRDFVSVYDVARACRLALEVKKANGKVFNIGSGNIYTIIEIAERIGKVLDKSYLKAEITGKYRVGDIRHCYADISQARKVLGFEPQVKFEDGVLEMAQWLEGQVAIDNVAVMKSELEERGLAV